MTDELKQLLLVQLPGQSPIQAFQPIRHGDERPSVHNNVVLKRNARGSLSAHCRRWLMLSDKARPRQPQPSHTDDLV
eukprot:3882870-Pleurochrysis_carterae.AAC.9